VAPPSENNALGGKYRPTWNAICYLCSADIPRPALAVFELLALIILKKIEPEAEIGSRWRHLGEAVLPFDRPILDGCFMSLCRTRLSATVCEFLRVLWFSKF
jgi:hypothetical protein